MNLPPDMILKFIKTLYGIPESGLHWYLTYPEHHISALNKIQSRVDPFLLFRRVKKFLLAMVLFQVDDSVIIEMESLLQTEHEMSAVLQSKRRKVIRKTKKLCNGVKQSVTSDKKITMTEQKKILDRKMPTTQESFRSQPTLTQYFGVNCRPDICPDVHLIASGNSDVKEEQYKSLTKAFDHFGETSDLGLNFIRLDVSSVRVFIRSDASFVNATGIRIQLGFAVFVVDNHNCANLVH